MRESQNENDSSEEDSQDIEERLNKLQQEEQKIKSQLKQLPYGLILQQNIQLQNNKSTLNNQLKTKNKKKNMSKNKITSD